MKRSLALLLLMVSCSLFIVPSRAEAQPSSSTHSSTRLFYYREGAHARASLFAHPNSIDILAPQTYSVDEQGKLSGAVADDILAFAKKHQIQVMPLLTNKGFTQASYQAILDEPAKQSALIDALVAEAKRKAYVGWEIDFEQMTFSYRERFSLFIVNLHEALARNNLLLSVAVIAKISDNPIDYPKNLWEKPVGVYDYTKIGANSDFVSIMSYDDPFSKGPVAGYNWLVYVLLYSVAHIPQEKVSLGIPFYYWLWEDSTGKRVGIGGNEGIGNVTKTYKVSYHFDQTENAPYMQYRKNGKDYTLWYENAKSIEKKVALIKNNGLHGFSAWALGLELPSVYGSMTK